MYLNDIKLKTINIFVFFVLGPFMASQMLYFTSHDILHLMYNNIMNFNTLPNEVHLKKSMK